MNLVRLVNEWYVDLVTSKELLKLENQVLTALDFDVQMETPINYLDRFMMLFNLDMQSCSMYEEQNQVMEIFKNSRYLARFSMRDAEFLEYKPSTIAAAAFIIALNTTFADGLPKKFETMSTNESHDTTCFNMAQNLSYLENIISD